MVDLFMEIYKDWGFKKDIVTFVSPCGCMGTPEDEGNKAYAEVLRARGIKYWCNSWHAYDPHVCTVEGLISTKGYDIVTWNAYDVDPDYIEPIGEGSAEGVALGMHLTNFIRFNHEKNFEYVPKWVNYFKKQAEVFGFLLARDMEDCSSQAMYVRFAKLTEEKDGFTVDLTELDKQQPLALRDEFYVSIRDPRTPTVSDGGEIALYETKGEFKTYKIKRTKGNKICVKF